MVYCCVPFSVFTAIVPVHINITEGMPTKDIKAMEYDLAAKLNEFYEALMDGSTEKYNSLWTDVKELWMQMELSGIRYKGSCQGNSITVFLWCRDSRAMSRLLQMQESGSLEKMLQQTLTFLANKVLSFSLKINKPEWKLAECYFQLSGKDHEVLILCLHFPVVVNFVAFFKITGTVCLGKYYTHKELQINCLKLFN